MNEGFDTVMLSRFFAHNYICFLNLFVVRGNGVVIDIIPFLLNKEENPNFQDIGNKIFTPLQ